MPEPPYERTVRYCRRCRANTDQRRDRPAGVLDALLGWWLNPWWCELCLRQAAARGFQAPPKR